MINLHTFQTGNGRRASIALEECGLPYRAHKIDIATGAQKSATFRAINPFCTIPVMIDDDGPGGTPVTISQSGAILLYCAEKSGRFLPADPAKRHEAVQWVFHSVSNAGEPIAGLFRLSRLPDRPDSALAFFRSRLAAILADVDRYLADREYLVGDISVADLAFYTVAAQGRDFVGIEGLDHLRRWLDRMSERPGVVRGMAVPG